MEHKRFSRRDFLRMGALTAAGAALAGCCPQPKTEPVVVTEIVKEAGKDVIKEVEVPVTVESGPSDAPEMVVLTAAHAWEAAFAAHQEEFDNMVMDEYPDLFIKRINNAWAEHNQIVPTWAAAGDLPDIIYVHGSRAYPWASEGISISTQAYIDADTAFDIEGFWEESLRLYRFEGEQHALPYDHGPVILGYNKNLFDEAGLDYPTEDWTWEGEFLAAAKALTKEGEQWGYSGYYGGVFGLGNEFGIACVGPWGGEIMNEDETELLLNSPESVAGLQFFYDLIHTHKVAPTPAQADAFPAGIWVAGVVGMFALATWGIPQMSEFGDFEYDVVPWPKGPAGLKTGSFGSGYAITKDSKHPDEAWLYMSQYLSKEGMEFMWGTSGRGSPARKAAYQSWLDADVTPENSHYYMEALDSYAVTGHPYRTLAAGEILDIFNQNMDLAQAGDVTVEEALQTIEDEVTPLL